jgi:hypothetical protein
MKRKRETRVSGRLVSCENRRLRSDGTSLVISRENKQKDEVVSRSGNVGKVDGDGDGDSQMNGKESEEMEEDKSTLSSRKTKKGRTTKQSL